MAASGRSSIQVSIVRATTSAALGSLVASTLFFFVVDFRTLIAITIGFFCGGLTLALTVDLKDHIGSFEAISISLAAGLLGGIVCAVLADLPGIPTAAAGTTLGLVFGIVKALHIRNGA